MISAFFDLVSDKVASAILAMVVASLLPWAVSIIAKVSGGFRVINNAHPRDFFQHTTGMAARANAAQQNSYETLPVFLAAVLVAMLFFVPQSIINVLAICDHSDWLLHRLYHQLIDVSLYSLGAIHGMLSDAVLSGNTSECIALPVYIY